MLEIPLVSTVIEFFNDLGCLLRSCERYSGAQSVITWYSRMNGRLRKLIICIRATHTCY